MECTKVKAGKIYKLKDGINLYDNEMFNRRYVVVTKKKNKFAQILPINILPAGSQNEYKLEFYYFGKDGGSAPTCVFYDMIKDVKYEYIEEEIGYINEDTLGKIEQKILEKENRDKEDTIIEIANKNTKSIEELKSGVNQTYTKLEETSDSANQTKEMIEESTKPINIWKERGISFIIGMITSLTGTFLWENRNNISTFLTNNLNEIEKYIQDLLKL